MSQDKPVRPVYDQAFVPPGGRFPMSSQMRRFACSLCAGLAVVLSGVGCQEAKPAGPPQAGPPPVLYIDVTSRRVELTTEWVATLDGLVNAQIRSQVSGYLMKRAYREGGLVRMGQVLFEIDPRPFEAVVAQARARLAEAKVALGRAERDLQRDRPLAEQRAIAQVQLDNDLQSQLAAEAAIVSAQAALSTAELNLSFTRITSPIDGLAAIATVQLGDLVNPSSLLTTVSQVDPIRAFFPLSEPEYLKLAARINAPNPARSLWADGPGLALVLADGSVYPRRGTFLAADREIDVRTGTIRMSATFPNPGALLRPGQYGKVRAQARVVDAAILVPQRAVSEMQGIRQVKVIGPGNKVSVRRVTMGDRVGTDWMVTEGIQAGERVVVDGVGAADGVVVLPKLFVPRPEGR